jgi:hypothetical protein
MSWNHWAVIAIGAWLIISPWILGFSVLNLAAWNSVLAGGLLIVMMVWDFTPPEE